jgi:phosphoadenosine phosphosulfate reductase
VTWAHQTFGKRAAILSAMQKAGCVVCEIVASMGLQKDIDVLFVDTGVNFTETYQTIDRLRERYGLNIIMLRPERTMSEQCAAEGVLYLSKDGQERCCDLRKKQPLRQIVGRYDALLASLRRDEGGRRKAIPAVGIDSELNLLRIHPLINMTRDQMEDRIRDRTIIVNPLHAQGYPTIGCDRCTTPVLDGESERSGRWRHLENAPQYCNINPTDRSRTGGDEFIEVELQLVERLIDFQI